ncbi:MAG: Holliday junction resolvase Hjc [Candidatus Bathyarchaeia archaeon]
MVRGIQDERSLVRLFYRKGFAAVRTPASGGSTKMPRPDIIASSRERGVQLAVEVKTTSRKALYIPREPVDQLVDFADRFGCRPVLALKFKGRRRGWLFVRPEDLSVTRSGNYRITFDEAMLRGMDLRELIGEGRQARLER